VVYEHANGRDSTPVRAGARPNRSISREVTFGDDVVDLARLRRTLARHAQRVGADLRRAEKRARTVTLKLRWDNFETLTRSRTLDRPVQSTAGLLEAGEAMLDEALRAAGVLRGTPSSEVTRPVRLIGLGATNLVEDELQLGLDDLLTAPVNGIGGELLEDRIDEMLDSIRERFGDNAVNRGL